MFNQPGTTSNHIASGKQDDKKIDLEAKLKVYNDYYDGKKQQIKSREVDGQLVLEGPILIHWRVQSYIKLAEKDESQASRETWRYSYTMAMSNRVDDFLQKLDVNPRPRLEKTKSISGYTPMWGHSATLTGAESPTRPRKSIMRNDGRRRQRHRTLSVINGHIFDVETSIFTPAYGSVTSVNVTNRDDVQAVIRLLLSKFKVENNPEDFCLCVVRNNGETHVLKESACPLIERIILGPLEDVAKLFIMDKGKVDEINEEVARYINLPEPVLKGFLEKIKQEEEEELNKIKWRYRQLRRELEKCLAEFNSTNL